MVVAELISAAANVLVVPFSDAGFDYRDSSAKRGLHLELGSSTHIKGRLLWQQRLLTVLLDELLPTVQASSNSVYVSFLSCSRVRGCVTRSENFNMPYTKCPSFEPAAMSYGQVQRPAVTQLNLLLSRLRKVMEF